MSDASIAAPSGQPLGSEMGASQGALPTAEGPKVNDFASALKEALVVGLIAAGLFIPLIGLKTGDGFFGIVYDQMGTALLLIAACAVGRFILAMTLWKASGPISIGDKVFRRAGGRKLADVNTMSAATTSKVIGTILGLMAIAFPFLVFLIAPGQDRLYINLAIQVLTYVMLGWGLNIVVGLAGLLDLGYVAFYAVGAYSFALLAEYFGIGFWFALPLAGMLAGTWGLILGFPVLRLRGDYLAIVTLAFGEIIRVVLLNWYEFTGGPDGIGGIPKPTLFGIEFNRGEGGFADVFGLEFDTIHRFVYLYYIILALALLTNFVTMRLRKLPVGRAWEAMREDEIACKSLGINTTNTKLTAFGIGAMFGGFAGSFFATQQGFISPESFVFIESAIILAIVVLGGLGSQIGVVVAAVIMIGGFQVFREFEEYRMLIFGVAMVVIMVWRPRGLVSSRQPSIVLGEQTIAEQEARLKGAETRGAEA